MAGEAFWRTIDTTGGSSSAWPLDLNNALSALTDMTTVRAGGAWAISGGVLRHTGTPSLFDYIRSNVSLTRFAIYAQCEIRVATQATADPHGGVVARWNGTDTESSGLLAASLWRVGSSGSTIRLRLHRTNSGFIDTTVAASLDTYHTIGLLVQGSQALAVFDGTPVAAASFTTPADRISNRVGLLGVGTVDYRNLKAWGSPVPTLT